MSNPMGGETLARFDGALAKLEDLMSLIAAFFILGLMFWGAAQVFSRKVLNWPLWGYVDIVEIGMATFAFLSISACQRMGGHIRMEIVIRRLSGRALWLAEWAGIVIAIGIMCVMLWYGSTAFMRAYELGDSTIDREIVTWPSKLLVPVAFSILLVRLLLQSWGYARLVAYPDAEPIAVPLMHGVEELAEKEIHDTFGDDDDSKSKEGTG